jgi:hypothetical protein
MYNLINYYKTLVVFLLVVILCIILYFRINTKINKQINEGFIDDKFNLNTNNIITKTTIENNLNNIINNKDLSILLKKDDFNNRIQNELSNLDNYKTLYSSNNYLNEVVNDNFGIIDNKINNNILAKYNDLRYNENICSDVVKYRIDGGYQDLTRRKYIAIKYIEICNKLCKKLKINDIDLKNYTIKKFYDSIQVCNETQANINSNHPLLKWIQNIYYNYAEYRRQDSNTRQKIKYNYIGFESDFFNVKLKKIKTVYGMFMLHKLYDEFQKHMFYHWIEVTEDVKFTDLLEENRNNLSFLDKSKSGKKYLFYWWNTSYQNSSLKPYYYIDDGKILDSDNNSVIYTLQPRDKAEIIKNLIVINSARIQDTIDIYAR